jgi:hypothetical protein
MTTSKKRTASRTLSHAQAIKLHGVLDEIAKAEPNKIWNAKKLHGRVESELDFEVSPRSISTIIKETGVAVKIDSGHSPISVLHDQVRELKNEVANLVIDNKSFEKRIAELEELALKNG